MRKIGIIVLILLFSWALYSNMNKQEEIRVRVIPNSDTTTDLVLKEKTKDMVVCYLKEGYSKDYSVFFNRINQTYTLLEEIIENELAVECTITFDKHTLYNKTYNNSAVENKNTMMLYVVLGTGKGSNWWGTVYPEFLQISSSEEIVYESLIVQLFQKIKGE